MKELFIVSARRTAIGGLNGNLSGLSAPELGSAAISAALEDSGVEYNAVSEVIMGCVLRLRGWDRRQHVRPAFMPVWASLSLPQPSIKCAALA